MNFLRSGNPFDLADPPKWFLKAMHTFDPQLVLFASLKTSVFRLARRCTHSPGVAPANVPGVHNHPDTLFMWNHKLVPVTTVIPGAHWTMKMFTELRARDQWAVGGANKVISLIADQEQRAREKQAAQFDTDGQARGVDAYQSFKYRTGQRVSMAHSGAAVNKQVRPQHFDRKVTLATR